MSKPRRKYTREFKLAAVKLITEQGRSVAEAACSLGVSDKQRQEQGWLTLTEAAAQLGVATATLRSAVEQERIAGEHPLADGPWIIQRQALQTQEAAEVVAGARRRRGTAATGSTESQDGDIPGDRKEGQCDAQEYNRQRRHSTLGYLSPAEYEQPA